MLPLDYSDPFSMSDVFKINPGLIMASSIPPVLKLFISIFYPAESNPSPTKTVLEGTLYLYINKIPYCGLQVSWLLTAPLHNICEFTIQKQLLTVISIAHQNPDLGIGEGKNTLNCARRDIGFNLWCSGWKLYNS